MSWTGIIIGLIIGLALGVLITGLCAISIRRNLEHELLMCRHKLYSCLKKG